MKLGALILLSLALAAVVMAQTATTPTTTATPTTPTTPTTPMMDPIVADYMVRARELYLKALIDYYHAHPERLRADLAILTTAEYEVMVPQELINEFNINRDEIDPQLRANDQDALRTAQAEIEDDIETSAVPATAAADARSTDATSRDFRINQWGWGFGRRFGWGGFGRGFGFGRFGFGFPFFGGFGFGFPGFGFGFPGFGFGFGRWGGFGWI